jgi:hypothetical protein
MVKAFNNIFERGFIEVCLVNSDDWDERNSIVLWVSRITCKKFTKHTLFDLVYG